MAPTAAAVVDRRPYPPLRPPPPFSFDGPRAFRTAAPSNAPDSEMTASGGWGGEPAALTEGNKANSLDVPADQAGWGGIWNEDMAGGWDGMPAAEQEEQGGYWSLFLDANILHVM